MVDDQELISTHIVNYFEHLYSCDSIPNQQVEIFFLTFLEEIKDAVFSMDPNSGSSSDVVDVDVVHFVQYFLQEVLAVAKTLIIISSFFFPKLQELIGFLNIGRLPWIIFLLFKGQVFMTVLL
ncbi:hypothetical protein ACOSP7_013023 [Xanthoceras sorbifolium]